MKRIFAGLLALLMLLPLLAACTPGEKTGNGKLQIVAINFPQYDWILQLLGKTDSAEVTLLLDNGVDAHSYQPTAEDMVSISSCDMLVYLGGESDGWVTDALKNATNKKMLVVNLLEVLGNAAKEEEIKAGMQHEEGDEGALDEHVWLSLKNAVLFCNYIAQQLCRLDANNTTAYTVNRSTYVAALKELDAQYQAMVDAAPNDTLLFADRFPFRYLVDDYGLQYFAAFPGCSAQTEASFATITFLVETINTRNLRYVMVIDQSDRAVANRVIGSTNSKDQTILALDSLQSVTAAQAAAGTTYLASMQNNLEVLREALS